MFHIIVIVNRYGERPCLRHPEILDKASNKYIYLMKFQKSFRASVISHHNKQQVELYPAVGVAVLLTRWEIVGLSE